MIIKPFSGSTTIKGYANKTTLDNARYVLVQHQGGSSATNPSGSVRYIHFVGAGDTDGTTNHRVVAIGGQSDQMILSKEPTDFVYATNGNGLATNAQSSNAGMLFTKIHNPYYIAKDKTPS